MALLSLPAIGMAAAGMIVGGVNAGEDDLQRGLATITAEDIGSHVRVLASDLFEGRAPASVGEALTVGYLTTHFEFLGIEPANDGSYLQEVPLVSKQVTDVQRAVLHSGNDETPLEFGDDIILGSATLDSLVRVDAAGIVFVGHGIVAPEYDWDDYDGLDVRGRFVMILHNDPGRVSGDSTFFKGRALSWYGTTEHKQEEAVRRGVRGIILVHDPDIMGYPWRTVAGGARQPKFALVPDGDEPEKTDVFVMVRRGVAVQVLAGAGLDYDEVVSQAGRKGFRGVDLGTTLDLEFSVELEYSKSYNVIGVLPGSRRPDEYVVYTAHWDHVGVGAAVDGDSIYNGAVDNATGTAALMEIAQAFSVLETGPERSVVFFATTAEEQGLLGSSYYAEHPLFPLEQTAAAINMDALFPFDDFNGMTVVAMGSSEVEEYLRDAAADHGRELEADPAPEFGAFFRSDHYPLAKKGVPAIFAVGGPLSDPAPSEELIKKYEDYLSGGYHKPADEYDESWDLRGIVGDTKIYFQTGYAIARDERFPEWYDGHEFRQRREQARAAAR